MGFFLVFENVEVRFVVTREVQAKKKEDFSQDSKGNLSGFLDGKR